MSKIECFDDSDIKRFWKPESLGERMRNCPQTIDMTTLNATVDFHSTLTEDKRAWAPQPNGNCVLLSYPHGIQLHSS